MATPNTAISRNHHWLFEHFIRSTDGIQLLLNLAFNPTQLSLINPKDSELLSTKSMAPRGHLQDADILIKIPLKQTTHSTSSMRLLIEVKSKVVRKELVLQLLRYHYGALSKDWTPVVALAVTNDAKFKLDEVLYLKDCMDDVGVNVFEVFDTHMMHFPVTVVNLCASRIQQQLMVSQSPAAIMLYAMGNIKVGQQFSLEVAKVLMRKSVKFSKAEFREYWLPVVQYVNDRKGLDYRWWLPLAEDIPGAQRMIELSWSNDEVNQKVGELRGIEIGRKEGLTEGKQEGLKEGKEEGIEEGLEVGKQIGALETKQTLAQAMLRDGMEKDFIKKYFEFSDDDVEALKNGHINSA